MATPRDPAGGRADDDAALEDAIATEETPLLLVGGEDEPGYLYRQNVTVLAFAAIFVFEMGQGIMTPATSSMMEAILCRDFYSVVGDPLSLADDARCKVPEIQGKLAVLLGWQSTFEGIPAIICAIPYGMLADRIGRKPVLLLGWLGIILSLIWTCAVCE